MSKKHALRFNGLLLERPWMNEDICQRSYLWWCAPTSRQYGISGEAEQAQMVEDMAERPAQNSECGGGKPVGSVT